MSALKMQKHTSEQETNHAGNGRPTSAQGKELFKNTNMLHRSLSNDFVNLSKNKDMFNMF